MLNTERCLVWSLTFVLHSKNMDVWKTQDFLLIWTYLFLHEPQQRSSTLRPCRSDASHQVILSFVNLQDFHSDSLMVLTLRVPLVFPSLLLINILMSLFCLTSPLPSCFPLTSLATTRSRLVCVVFRSFIVSFVCLSWRYRKHYFSLLSLTLVLSARSRPTYPGQPFRMSWQKLLVNWATLRGCQRPH